MSVFEYQKAEETAHVFCSSSSLTFLKYLRTVSLPFCGLAKISYTVDLCWGALQKHLNKTPCFVSISA